MLRIDCRVDRHFLLPVTWVTRLLGYIVGLSTGVRSQTGVVLAFRSLRSVTGGKRVRPVRVPGLFLFMTGGELGGLAGGVVWLCGVKDRPRNRSSRSIFASYRSPKIDSIDFGV